MTWVIVLAMMKPVKMWLKYCQCTAASHALHTAAHAPARPS